MPMALGQLAIFEASETGGGRRLETWHLCPRRKGFDAVDASEGGKRVEKHLQIDLPDFLELAAVVPFAVLLPRRCDDLGQTIRLMARRISVELSLCGRRSFLSRPLNASSLNHGERVWFTEEESCLSMPRRRYGRAWQPIAKTIAPSATSGCSLPIGPNITMIAACGTRGRARPAAINSRRRYSSHRAKPNQPPRGG